MRTFFIDPGKLSHELQLERRESSEDDSGGLIENWVEIASVWALIEPAEAGLRLFGEQGLNELTHRITLRMRGDMTTAMRLRKGRRIFQILTMHDPDESGRYLVCRVREEVS
jgi:SPP1 family predicted phage head-tail adaptor